MMSVHHKLGVSPFANRRNGDAETKTGMRVTNLIGVIIFAELANCPAHHSDLSESGNYCKTNHIHT
jgi:hypothetical protein